MCQIICLTSLGPVSFNKNLQMSLKNFQIWQTIETFAKIIKNHQNKCWFLWQFFRHIFSFEMFVHFMIVRLFLKKWDNFKFERKMLFFFCTFFFSNSKLSHFPQKQSYNHKIYRQYTLGSKLKMCRKKLLQKPTFILLSFDDFGKNFNFLPNLGFFGAYLRGFTIVGNRQTLKKFYFH